MNRHRRAGGVRCARMPVLPDRLYFANTMKLALSPPDQTDAWEAAYQRFETPEEEIRKFTRRLHKFGADSWNRDALVVELFCGRGNGLHALHQFGFHRVEGIDLSPTLAARYQGTGRVN